MNPRFYTLWAINAPLDKGELCSQLDLMRGWGFDGAVFHPRFYPDEPPYLSDEYFAILSQVILYAKSIGMEFWLYDENGWPSGMVGGKMLEHHPGNAQQWAEVVTEQPSDCLSSFAHGGQRWYVALRRGTGVDYLSSNLARNFLEMTYDRYRQGLVPAAFDHVTTVFCDEPEFGLGHAYDQLSPHGAIPWTPRVPELFQQRYGESLVELLPLLFFPLEGYRQTRVRFWELLTDLFCESFVGPLDEWCRQHGKRFTAHMKGEEHPLFQVPMVGSCHQVFQHLALPGIDALERYPSGHFFPRQVASAARQFGDGDCMVECFGGAGWGATPEDFEEYLEWLAGHGLNHFVIHLYQHQLTTQAIRDWPPSSPAHLNWSDVFPIILERIRRYSSSVSTDADVLFVAPYRGIMAEYEPRELLQTNIHNASTYPDTPAGRLNSEFLKTLDRVHRSGAAYHLSDERTIEQHGQVRDGVLSLGGCTYHEVVLADGVQLDSELQLLLAPLTKTPDSDPIHATQTSETVHASINVAWNVQPDTMNDLVLEVEALGASKFAASFEATVAVELELFSADKTHAVTFNGTSIEGWALGLCVVGRNEICVECPGQRLPPFLSVRGRFSVRSLTPYVAGPNRTMTTAGPFVLDTVGAMHAEDCVAAGYPFCRDPLAISGKVELQLNQTALRLLSVQADCAQVSLSGMDCGWCWGPDWTVPVPNALTGSWRVEVRLTPSTFNFFGPHHHITGDPTVVSPSQYAYTKNFADRPDAPANTRTDAWHFKPLGIGRQIQLLYERPLKEEKFAGWEGRFTPAQDSPASALSEPRAVATGSSTQGGSALNIWTGRYRSRF